MAFQRLSLRGFSSEFNVRRQIEIFNGSLICTATLYQGRHIRRRIDRMRSGIPSHLGLSAARAVTEKFRAKLIERYRLEPLGFLELTEVAADV